jgi:hypothetical protein
MTAFSFGELVDGVRFGVRPPGGVVTAGGPINIELLCENHAAVPVWVFGFKAKYPRSLRVSPPKPDRPWVRVSFGDGNVLHPPDAFTRLAPGESITTGLDLSFAFDRRGAGAFPVVFAYETVRGMGRLRGYTPSVSVSSGIASLVVERAASLREAGIDAALEASLDALLLGGEASGVEQLHALGLGGAAYAARRVTRVLGAGPETLLGWKALEALERLGTAGLEALHRAREDMPHAAPALDFAADWIRFRTEGATDPRHLPFVTALEQLIHQPDRRGNFVLSWTAYDSPVHGSSRMEIFGNGDRIVVVRPAGQSVPSTRRTQLGPMHMHGLLENLLMSGVWLLRPLRALGMPDEPRPALELSLEIGETYTRKIALWNGEWRQGPGFRVADMLDRLALAVRPEHIVMR